MISPCREGLQAADHHKIPSFQIKPPATPGLSKTAESDSSIEESPNPAHLVAHPARAPRPLFTKWPVHVVFKADKLLIPGGLRTPKRFRCTLRVLQRYAYMFFVKVEQFSIQNDHIHMLIRSSRRTNILSFLRVLAGQVAQEFGKLDLMKKFESPKESLKAKAKLWKQRPFTRVVLGKKAYKTARDYLQLNELEVTGVIKYRKERLRGLSEFERLNLWTISKPSLSP